MKRTQRRVSRRRFLRDSAAVSAAVAGAFAVGCGDEEKPPPEATATPVVQPAASRGGVLRTYNFNALYPDSFDPHLSQFGEIANVHSAVFSRLLRYDDEREGTIVPDLADGMPEQPDEVTYVIKLRRTARFHDSGRARYVYGGLAGRGVEPADVKYSIERQLNRNSPQASRFARLSSWTPIDQISVRDRHTLMITLKAATAPFINFLAGRHAFVVPHEVIDANDELRTDAGLIGSGPFMVEGFDHGVAVRLIANPAWFGRDDDADGIGAGRPFLDGYTAYFSPQDDVFQRAALQRQLVDSTGFADPAALDAEHTTNLADIVLEETDAGGFLASRFLVDRAPFRDDRVRRAIHLAIDRRALLALMYPAMAGAASARLSGPIAPVISRFAIDDDTLALRDGYRAERAEDIAEAKRLWAAATGTESITSLPVVFAGIPRAIPERAVGFVTRQLKEVLGTDVVATVDTSGGALLASGLRRNVEGAAEGTLPFTFMLDEGGVDLDDWLYQFRNGQPANTYRVQDATLDAQLDRQRTEFDNDLRKQIGLDIQDYLLGHVNARLEFCAPVSRRLSWGYVRNSHWPIWQGSDQALADTWLDSSHAAWAARPA